MTIANRGRLDVRARHHPARVRAGATAGRGVAARHRAGAGPGGPGSGLALPGRRLWTRGDDASAGPEGRSAGTGRGYRRRRGPGRGQRCAAARRGSPAVRVPRPRPAQRDAAIPGAPYDLVYARLVLFHLPERVAVLGRLWDAVAPGGHLVVQDYDLAAVGSVPRMPIDDQLAGFILRCLHRGRLRGARRGPAAPAVRARRVSDSRTRPTSPAGWTGSPTPRRCWRGSSAASCRPRSAGAW